MMEMRHALLTYFSPEPWKWPGLAIQTKEQALQYARASVGKTILIGMQLCLVKSYEVLVNEQDTRYGRIFVHAEPVLK